MIIHLDLDAFYAAVEQKLDPSLKGQPFIVAQKNCVATLSYAARDLGFKKLSTVREVMAQAPEMQVVNGESLAKYRKAGKELVKLVRGIVPSCAVERLGLEELWIDVTDVVEYNFRVMSSTGLLDLINQQDSQFEDEESGGVNIYLTPDGDDDGSFFCEDFMVSLPGSTYPASSEQDMTEFTKSIEHFKLYIATHVAWHIQESIFTAFEYTCSIGVAENKTLAKMVGGLNKPRGLTTLIPEYAQAYLDPLPVSKIPYCGRKTVEEIRTLLLGDKEPTVEEIRRQFSRAELNDIRPGLYDLIRGIDTSKVQDTPLVPTQISIEDSYWNHQCDTQDKVRKEVRLLVTSLVNQLIEDVIDVEAGRWIAKPKTMRLAVRPPRASNTQRRAKQVAVPQFFYKLCHLGLDEDQQERYKFIDKLLEEFMCLYKAILSQTKNSSVELINVAMTNIKTTDTG